MKLLYVSTARIPDEWAHVIQILKMCEAFAKAGHEVTLLIPRRSSTRSTDPFAYARIEESFSIRRLSCIDLFPGTQSRFFYWVRTITFLIAAKVYVLKHVPDCIYARELPVALAFKKAIIEVHTLTNILRKQAARLLGKRAVIVLTHLAKTDLIALGIAPSLIHVAPDGVSIQEFSTPEFRAQARERLNLPSAAKIALYIGLLGKWKGTHVFCASARFLGNDILTVLIGGFPEQLEEQRLRYPEVRFLGSRPYSELADNMQAADVLVLPNSSEDINSMRYTSPLKLFAYMASGIPIVASDLPSFREVLDESTALFVRPDAPQALAAGITETISNTIEAEKRATRAKQKVHEYSWEARARGILAFIPTSAR